ncbi:MAG: BatD family protein, partial [Planctomyces sp.]|nr:BatD family protein [Planctomyces sp.]
MQNQRDPFANPYDPNDFFGRNSTEFVDIKDDAFLAITTSKSEVYVGEGFTTSLSFFVADKNRAPLQFYDLAKQLTNILKKIKPANCWEENFDIENVQAQSVMINGEYYDQYKLYEATFYPLNTKPIEFPSIGLQLIKFKVAKNPSFFGQNRKEDFKTFYSKPKTIKVKEL